MKRAFDVVITSALLIVLSPLAALALIAMAADMLVCARDPELRERMGNAGRARVIPRYSVQRLVDDVDRLYRSLLQTS